MNDSYDAVEAAIGYLHQRSLGDGLVHVSASDEERLVNRWAEKAYQHIVESTVDRVPTDLTEFAEVVRSLADVDRVFADMLVDLGRWVQQIRRTDRIGMRYPVFGLQTMAGLNSATTPSPPSPVPVSIYLSEEDGHERVEAAVDVLLSEAGLRVSDREDPVTGSWFRRLRAQPAVREAAMMAAHAAEARLVHERDAAITATMMQSLGPVIRSLRDTREAVIRVGALLIVKVDDRVVVHQLTAAQQFALDHDPALATTPRDVLAALGLPDQSAVDALPESRSTPRNSAE